MATLLQDDFNRANSTTVPGAPLVGPTPTALTGVWGIFTNQLYASTVGILSYELGAVEVDYQMTIAGAATTFNPITHIVNATNFWLAQWGSAATGLLYRCNAGLFQPVGSLPVVTVGTVVRTVYKGGVFRCYAGTKEVLYYEVPENMRPTATAHGMRATSTNQRFEDVLVQDAPALPADLSGGQYPVAQAALGSAPESATSFLYRGRDTKSDDLAGVS